MKKFDELYNTIMESMVTATISGPNGKIKEDVTWWWKYVYLLMWTTFHGSLHEEEMKYGLVTKPSLQDRFYATDYYEKKNEFWNQWFWDLMDEAIAKGMIEDALNSSRAEIESQEKNVPMDLYRIENTVLKGVVLMKGCTIDLENGRFTDGYEGRSRDLFQPLLTVNAYEELKKITDAYWEEHQEWKDQIPEKTAWPVKIFKK